MSTFAVFGMTETYAYEEAKKKVEPLDGKRRITEAEWLVKVNEYVDDLLTAKTRKVKLDGLYSSPSVCKEWIDLCVKTEPRYRDLHIRARVKIKQPDGKYKSKWVDDWQNINKYTDIL